MNFLFKLVFSFNRLPVVIILTQSDSRIVELLSISINKQLEVLKLSSDWKLFPVFGKKILLIDISNKKSFFPDITFLLRKSLFPVLIINKRIPDGDILKCFSNQGLIVADFETARKLKSEGISVESVGFNERSDLWVSDLNVGNETNFKINHGGNSVPFWISGRIENEEMTEILLAIKTGIALGLNLVQISQNFNK